MKLESSLPVDFGLRPSYGGNRVTLVEQQGAVLCSLTHPTDDLISNLSAGVGCALPRQHGMTSRSGSRCGIWLSPRSWIVLCEPGEEATLVESVAQKFPDRDGLASLYSDAVAWLKLSGPHVEDILRQGGFLSLTSAEVSIGFAKRTLLAGIPAVILKEGASEWTVGIECSRMRYFADWLSNLENMSEAHQ